MTIGLTDSQNYSDIADAIRAKRTDLPAGTTFTPSQMADAISGITGGGTPTPTPTPYHWVRPSEWPDLDSVYNDEENTIWMTVDATGRFEYPCVKFAVMTNPTPVTVTIQTGTITNGVFTVSATETLLSNQTFTYEWTPSTGFYPVIKVTANGMNNITFYSVTTNAGTTEPQPHIIEWIGHADYVFSSTPRYVVREKISADFCANDRLRERWSTCYLLESLDLSGYATEDWEISTLYRTWYYCYSLRELNLSGWNTTNWAVTTLGGTWQNCRKLQSLDISGWDTSDWAVTTLSNTWNTCTSLRELDLSEWDTSGWAVTTLSGTWNGCSSLQSLDLSEWDTSDWAVTDLSSTWNGCSSLQSLDLSEWDTSGWAVTSLAATWQACSSLQSLDLSEWDTSDWAVTTFSSHLGTTNSLIELKLPQNFYGCYTGTNSISIASSGSLLSRASILSVFNALPTISSSKTVSINSVNKGKMTASEIAIATNKGWTVS